MAIERGEHVRKGLLWTAVTAALAVSVLALRTDLKVVHNTVESGKLKTRLRLALLTDLHSCAYGQDQRTLLNRLDKERPDVVLLGGDMVDDKLPQANAAKVLTTIGGRYPSFYVAGNHENRSGQLDTIKALVSACGITVLAGDCVRLDRNGQTVAFAGVDDPAGAEKAFVGQLARCGAQVNPGVFTVLLTHRPERVERYLSYGFDLILAGHAHGGQWRIPGLLNGLLAPGQGLIPPYAGGQYSFSSGTMIVSRGLARESTMVPRIFNRPELVIVDLLPETGRIVTATFEEQEGF